MLFEPAAILYFGCPPFLLPVLPTMSLCKRLIMLGSFPLPGVPVYSVLRMQFEAFFCDYDGLKNYRN
jgi:hypothetical protein